MYQTVDPSALQDWIAGLQACDRIGLDTEFMRISTYWPQLALLQVGAGESVFVLDPLALTGLDALAGVCAAAKPQKIMHAAGEDLAALRRHQAESGLSVVTPADARRILGGRDDAWAAEIVGPQAIYTNFRRRKMQAMSRTLTHCPGPRKVAEEYVIVAFLQR